jgi:NAD(P)-dependent dehydrogenase (short-subunit alcohol dehydrogenase family)
MATALITGANRGIGLELTRLLAGRGDTVIACCRERSPELDALGVEVREGVDVTSETAVAALARDLAGRQLDLLVLNAGVLSHETLDELDLDAIRWQFDVNALGPLRVTADLRGCLPKGGKVALITSRMGSIADNGSGGAYGYRMSKAALNAAGVSLAHDLRDQGVAVAILHPGFVRTRMTNKSGHLEPAESARMLLERIDALTLETSGTFWHANGEVLPW